MGISERFIQNQEEISLKSLPLFEESPDLLISQSNTIYAANPLYHPGNQLLGSGGFPEKEEREIISYSVRPGDSLSGIASHFGISRDTIVWANKLSGSTIKPGQELVILPVSGVFHIVEKGDTVEKIASKYKAKSGDIFEFNGLNGEEIRLGDILVVPGGEIAAPVITATPRPSSSSVSWLIPPASGYISQGLHWYNAVDIANNCGTPIYASASGVIQATGYHSIGGNYVRILHSNGVVTYYGHLSRIIVSRGQSVFQGSVIGYMGNTGYTIGPTGCHVHFEVRGGTNPFGAYRRGHRF